jgi:hypothetical protein
MVKEAEDSSGMVLLIGCPSWLLLICCEGGVLLHGQTNKATFNTQRKCEFLDVIESLKKKGHATTVYLIPTA